jgi:hypothetical protein
MLWKPTLLPLLGCLLASAPALAGDAYDFTVTRQEEGGFAPQPGGGPAEGGDLHGRLIVDGRSYRLEPAPGGEDPPLYQALVSNDGGAHEIALNLKNRTFFAPHPPKATSGLLRVLPIGEASVSNVALESSEAPEMLAGVATRRREIHLSYDVTLALSAPGRQPSDKPHVIETVHGKVTVEAVYWLAPGTRPALPELLRPEIRTGFAEVDARLAAATAALDGIPLQQRVTISSTGDQGATPQRSVRTVRLESHKRADTRPALFEVPPGFRKHEPQMSHPGLGGALPPG